MMIGTIYDTDIADPNSRIESWDDSLPSIQLFENEDTPEYNTANLKVSP
jgi:hypothetical protein